MRARSKSLYHCRQCNIVLEPRSDRTNYTVVCFDARLQPKVVKTQYDQCELSVVEMYTLQFTLRLSIKTQSVLFYKVKWQHKWTISQLRVACYFLNALEVLRSVCR